MVESETPAYENPLIPNARLRQIYLAMLRAQMLEKALPAARRTRAVAAASQGYATGIAGLEACLASTSVDLGPHDLVSDALTGGVIDFLRGATLDSVLRPAQRPKRRTFLADCGTAFRLAPAPGLSERLWSAMGAAAAVKAQSTHARKSANPDGSMPSPRGVALVYARPTDFTGALAKKVLTSAAQQELPIVFVLLPPPRIKLAAANARASRSVASALALRHRVPGIAVDADDAVAIYRVAQESIGRARAGGGPALIECVPFILQGPRAAPQDSISALERYLLHRGIATRAWMDREARTFATRL